MDNLIFKEWKKVKEVRGRWYGGEPGQHFRCAWCGYCFIIGDEYNMVFTNNSHDSNCLGNPLVCRNCFNKYNNNLLTELERRSELIRDYIDSYWWFFRRH